MRLMPQVSEVTKHAQLIWPCWLAACVAAADQARRQLAAQIQQHTQKAKQARIDEAAATTEVTLSKLIAVNAVELLSTFPADLWKQLHAARKQVR